jgi:hypothetical protein
MRNVSLCDFCRFRRAGIPMTCEAFPDGVPDRFRFGHDVHIDPVEGDHGIQFELDPNLPEPCRRIAMRMVVAYREKQHQQASAED